MSQMIQHEMFKVSGNCDLCKDRIEKAAKSIHGVKTAVWNTKTKEIHVEFNTMETNLDVIQKAIAKAGHDVGNIKANDKDYNNLPECYKYRN